MAAVTHLSASQLTLYLQCSLKYRFHYVDQIEAKFKSSGLAFGGTIHSTLEWLHRHGPDQENRNAASRAVSIYNAWAATQTAMPQQTSLFEEYEV